MGLSSDSDPSRSSRQPKTWTAIHRFGRKQASEGDGVSPPAAGSGTERRSAGRPASRSRTRAGRAINTAPNPGTS